LSKFINLNQSGGLYCHPDCIQSPISDNSRCIILGAALCSVIHRYLSFGENIYYHLQGRIVGGGYSISVCDVRTHLMHSNTLEIRRLQSTLTLFSRNSPLNHVIMK